MPHAIEGVRTRGDAPLRWASFYAVMHACFFRAHYTGVRTQVERMRATASLPIMTGGGMVSRPLGIQILGIHAWPADQPRMTCVSRPHQIRKIPRIRGLTMMQRARVRARRKHLCIDRPPGARQQYEVRFMTDSIKHCSRIKAQMKRSETEEPRPADDNNHATWEGDQGPVRRRLSWRDEEPGLALETPAARQQSSTAQFVN